MKINAKIVFSTGRFCYVLCELMTQSDYSFSLMKYVIMKFIFGDSLINSTFSKNQISGVNRLLLIFKFQCSRNFCLRPFIVLALVNRVGDSVNVAGDLFLF